MLPLHIASGIEEAPPGLFPMISRAIPLAAKQRSQDSVSSRRFVHRSRRGVLGLGSSAVIFSGIALCLPALTAFLETRINLAPATDREDRNPGCTAASSSSLGETSKQQVSRADVTAVVHIACTESTSDHLERRWLVVASALLSSIAVWARGSGAAYAKFGQKVIAQDQQFQEVEVSKWAVSSNGSPGLVVGIRGDPYWLLPGQTGALKSFALRAECTHLGCIAPWDEGAGRFVCPCHGSEYDAEGRVMVGPAATNLALSHVAINDDGKVQLTSWSENDFRDDSVPWWKF